MNGRAIEDLSKHQCALDYVKYEGQLLWQVFGWFLLAHTVFLAFLLNTASNDQIIASYKAGAFFTALIGLLLCIPWLTTNVRNSAYYTFRISQAKESEPPDWNYLRGVQEAFGAGEEVQLEPYRIPWAGRVLPTRHSGPVLISVFAFVYLGILILKGPWWY